MLLVIYRDVQRAEVPHYNISVFGLHVVHDAQMNVKKHLISPNPKAKSQGQNNLQGCYFKASNTLYMMNHEPLAQTGHCMYLPRQITSTHSRHYDHYCDCKSG